MSLFLVQDNDRPMWVVARSWAEAIEKWQSFVGQENDLGAATVNQPTGVQLVCEDDELIL